MRLASLSVHVRLSGEGQRMFRLIRFALISCILISAISAAHAASYTYVVEQLTDNAISEGNPQVSGNNVTWWAQPGTSTTRDILFNNGTTTLNLTDGPNYNFYNSDPQISGNNVVWWGQVDGTAANQREILKYDGVQVTRLTNDTVRDYPPVISGSTAVWEHNDGNSKEIYRSNGAPLTSNAVVDAQPDVFGSRVVWVEGSTPAQKVQLFNGTTTVTAGSSTLAMNKPQVNDGYVVWQGFKNTNSNSSGAEIYRYDGTNAVNPTNLSNNEIADFDPQVSGNQVVWWGGLVGVYDVYYYNGSSVSKLSQTSTQNQFPKIDGNLIVWQGFDGHDLEIFAYDGNSVVPLTNNEYDDTVPQVSGNHIVWQAQVGGAADNEILSARRVKFGDSNFDGQVDGADYVNWADNFLQSNRVFAQGDFNQDGIVDGADYVLWADNFLAGDSSLSSQVTTSAVPEPASVLLGLIGIGVCGIAWCRARGRTVEQNPCR